MPLRHIDPFPEPSEPNGEFLILPAGGRLYFTQLPASLVGDADLEIALLNRCMFNGMSTEFYSLAQHALTASLFFTKPATAIAALLKPAAEAFVGSLATPFRVQLPAPAAARIESVMAQVEAYLLETTGVKLDEADRVMVARRETMIWHACYWNMVLGRSIKQPIDGTFFLMYQEAWKRYFDMSHEIAARAELSAEYDYGLTHAEVVDLLRLFPLPRETVRDLFQRRLRALRQDLVNHEDRPEAIDPDDWIDAELDLPLLEMPLTKAPDPSALTIQELAQIEVDVAQMGLNEDAAVWAKAYFRARDSVSPERQTAARNRLMRDIALHVAEKQPEDPDLDTRNGLV